MIPNTIDDLSVDWLRRAFNDTFIVENVDISPVKKDGTSYLSTIVQANVYGTNSLGIEETKSVFIKLIPSVENFHEFVKESHCFPREIEFYSKLYPSLLKLCSHLDMKYLQEMLPKLYYGKYQDYKGVLIIEDISNQGFRVPRKGWFTLEQQTEVLNCLADFNAVSHLYRSSVRNFSEEYPHISKPVSRGIYLGYTEAAWVTVIILSNIEELKSVRESFESIISGNEIHEIFEKCEDYSRNILLGFSHFDLWINNMMFTSSNTESPPEIRLIDWQTVMDISPLFDVVMCIMVNSDMQMLQSQLLQLLKSYHNRLVRNMKLLNFTFEYTFETFLKDFRRMSIAGILFAIVVTFVVKAAGFFAIISKADDEKLVRANKSNDPFYTKLYDQCVTEEIKKRIVSLFHVIKTYQLL